MSYDILKDLNPEQKQAAQTLNGPILILAGAGSGKTKTLTHRIAFMLHKGVKAENILAVTFTNKAAAEMKERVRKLLGAKAVLPMMGTFHSICLRILRVEIERLGYNKNFVIYDTQDQKSLMKKVCVKQRIDTKKTNPTLFLYLISGAKNELMTPKMYAAKANEYNEELAAQVYEEYQKQLKDANALDFDDLIMMTVQIFQQNPEVLKKYQNRFKYLMVDEYQDTNRSQYTLVKLLADASRNICVVGDDWQAIYSFRGADLQNILDFEKDYPEAKVFKLERNYRSTQKILDAAQSVISANPRQKKKKLWTDQLGGEDIHIFELQDERDEAAFVARSIRDKVLGKNQSYSDFAILYRTNAQSRAMEEACLEYNIPYRVVGGIRFYDRAEIKDVLSYLSLMKNQKDLVSFERIINVPSRGIGKATVDRVMEFSMDLGIELVTACERAQDIPGLQASKVQALLTFGQMLAKLRDAETKLTLDHFIEYVVTETGYKDSLLDGTQEGEARYENIEELKTVARRYPTLESFLENVALVADTDSYDENAQTVTLMSLHASKGLEFKHIYIIGMEEGILPHAQSMMSQADIDEERRLTYVGMTRAKQTLNMSFATYRTLYGESRVNGISRFLEEIPDDLVRKNLSSHSIMYSSKAKEPVVSSDSDFVDETFENPFTVGDYVYHATFGKGRVVGADDDIVEVEFEKGGSRELSVAHAPLKKLES